MLSWTRPGRVVTGGLLLAALAGGPARAQEIPDLAPLDLPATVPPPALPALPAPMLPPGAGGYGLEEAAPAPALPAPAAGAGRHAGPRVRPDLSDRWTRRIWRRFHWQEHFLGYPEEFPARPLGASVYENNRTQVANAAVAQLILYDYDFVEGSKQLNLHGRDRLAEIMEHLPETFHPLIIERTPRHPGLDEVRRLEVLSQIAQSAFPIPAERIRVGAPIARGLDPVDAEVIHNTRVDRVRRFGPLIQQQSISAQ
jgi:hypothetical protein